MIDHYDWPGGREAMLRFGPAAKDSSRSPVVVAAMPLFEEANRTRTFVVTILHLLAERGIGSVLPDLPGTAESEVATVDATLPGWRAAYAAAAVTVGRPVYSIAIRGGAMIDNDAVVAGRWRLSPADGATLERELVRAQIMAAGKAGTRIDVGRIDDDGPPFELSGNLVSRKLFYALRDATAAAGRTVRFRQDQQAADLTVAGVPPWRRAEPGNDPALAARLALDIATWIARCEG